MSLEQMMHTIMEETAYLPETNASLSVSELAEAETNEVIGFLAERPILSLIHI